MERGRGAPTGRRVGAVVAVIALLIAGVANAATLVLVDEQVTPGTYARVDVSDIPNGNATLTSGGFTTTWPHRGGRVRVPILVPAGLLEAWPVTINGETFDLPTIADEPARPATVEPLAYDAVAAWQPVRPTRHRVTLLVVLLAGLVSLVLPIRLRYRLAGTGVAIGLLLLIAWTRPKIATRVVDVGELRWTFFRPFEDGGRATVELPFSAELRPVAFSADHLERLRPTLALRSDGKPLTLTLQLDGVAAVVQELAAPADDAPDWARPLRRFVRR